MKTRFTLLSILVVIFALATMPSVAQDSLSAEETELIEYVRGAIEQYRALESVKVEGEGGVTSKYINKTGGTEVTLFAGVADSTFNGEVLFNDDSIDSSVTLEVVTSKSEGSATDFEMTIEIIALDNNQYSRLSLGDFSLGWTMSSGDEGQLFNLGQFTGTLNRMLDLPVDEDTVISAEEMPAEILDGEEMQVVHLVFDAPELFRSGVFDWLIQSAIINGGEPDIEASRETFAENATLEATYWIDSDGQIRSFAETTTVIANDVEELAGSGTIVDYTNDFTTHLSYSDFNEPITIEAPEVGS